MPETPTSILESWPCSHVLDIILRISQEPQFLLAFVRGTLEDLEELLDEVVEEPSLEVQLGLLLLIQLSVLLLQDLPELPPLGDAPQL